MVDKKEPVFDIPLESKEYFKMMILGAIPLIGIPYLLYLVFIKKDGNKNEVNFAKSYLIVMVITFCIGIICDIVFFS